MNRWIELYIINIQQVKTIFIWNNWIEYNFLRIRNKLDLLMTINFIKMKNS